MEGQAMGVRSRHLDYAGAGSGHRKTPPLLCLEDLAPGFKFGPYFTRLTYGAYCYVGAHFDFDYHQTDLRMSQIYTFVHEDTFVLVNLFAIILTVLLLVQFRRTKSDHEIAA